APSMSARSLSPVPTSAPMRSTSGPRRSRASSAARPRRWRSAASRPSDFVDVRDCVAALVLIAECGQPGQVYNVCNGVPVGLTEVVETFCSLAKRRFEVRPNPALIRPVDDLRVVGDPKRLAALGYVRAYPLLRTLEDTLNRCRREADDAQAR